MSAIPALGVTPEHLARYVPCTKDGTFGQLSFCWMVPRHGCRRVPTNQHPLSRHLDDRPAGGAHLQARSRTLCLRHQSAARLLDLDTDRIFDVEATLARFAAEVATTRTLVSRAGTRLGIAPSSHSADKAYGSGPPLVWLIERNITPCITVIDSGRQRDTFFTRDAFSYN